MSNPAAPPSRSFFPYLGRALRLRCPVCGRVPIFPPLSRTRRLYDWFTPLDGCPRCGYAYEREPGYFLMAIWAINYGFSGLFATALYLLLEWKTQLDTGGLMACVLIPTACFSLLAARHAKALFIAIDHFFDPAERR